MLTANSTQINWTRILSRFFTASFLSAIALLGGFVPEVSRQIPKLVFSFSAYAQDFSQQEVVNYTKAVYQVELLRRQVYDRLKETTSEPPSGIVCDRPDTYSHLTDNVREIVVNHCDRFKEIVRENNLSVSRFNELKSYYDRGDGFYQQVQNVLIEMQR
jgi:hypothetical protein